MKVSANRGVESVVSTSALWWRRRMRWIGGDYSAPRWHRIDAPGMTVCGRPVADGETRPDRPERAICHSCEARDR